MTSDGIVVLSIIDSILVAMFFLFRVLPWAKPGPWRIIWIMASLTAALFCLSELAAMNQGGSAVSFEVQGPLFGAILATTTCFILAYLHGYRLNEHALTLALTDDLTKLPNLRAFTTRVDLLLQKQQSFNVAYIELEGLDVVNDLYGSHRGDAFLREFADVLRNSVASGDVVGRLGGDEFALLLVGEDMQRARLLTERVLAALADLVVRELGAIEVGASIGIVSRGQESDANRLLRVADRAMHDAKRAGGNRVALAGES